LGGAETVAQLRLTPAAVAQSAFFEEWSTLVTALAVVLANAAADAAKVVVFSSSSTSSSPWKGTFYASLWAVLTALYALVKVEVDQARVLSSWTQLKESAVVAVGASGVALALLLNFSSSSSSSSTSSSPLPALDLASGGKAAARILYVATEIKVETVPPFLVALPLALVAGVIVPLLAGSAARAARAVSLTATRTPEWGREMLFAHKFVDRCALRCSVLIAPLVAALLWLEPCARLWVSGGGGSGGGGGSSDGGDDGSAERRSVDALRSFSLLLAALSSVCAARPSVVAHCGTALVVWWTRKHGFVSRRNGKKKKKGGGSVAAAVEKEETEAEAASRRLGSNRRAGEVLRLSMQFINLFALKAGVQALAPGLLWLGCGAVSSSSALGALLQSKNGSENGSGSGSGSGSDLEQISLWLGGWSAAVFALCSLWHLALYWCGWLTDVPAGGKR